MSRSLRTRRDSTKQAVVLPLVATSADSISPSSSEDEGDNGSLTQERPQKRAKLNSSTKSSKKKQQQQNKGAKKQMPKSSSSSKKKKRKSQTDDDEKEAVDQSDEDEEMNSSSSEQDEEEAEEEEKNITSKKHALDRLLMTKKYTTLFRHKLAPSLTYGIFDFLSVCTLSRVLAVASRGSYLTVRDYGGIVQAELVRSQKHDPQGKEALEYQSGPEKRQRVGQRYESTPFVYDLTSFLLHSHLRTLLVGLEPAGPIPEIYYTTLAIISKALPNLRSLSFTIHGARCSNVVFPSGLRELTLKIGVNMEWKVENASMFLTRLFTGISQLKYLNRFSVGPLPANEEPDEEGGYDLQQYLSINTKHLVHFSRFKYLHTLHSSYRDWLVLNQEQTCAQLPASLTDLREICMRNKAEKLFILQTDPNHWNFAAALVKNFDQDVKFKKLKKLEIGRIMRTEFVPLYQCFSETLTSLRFDQWYTHEVSWLAGMRELRTLHIDTITPHPNHLPPYGFRQIPPIDPMQKINVEQLVEAMKELQKLLDVKLWIHYIEDKHFKGLLTSLTSVKHLSIGSSSVTSIVCLSSLPHLARNLDSLRIKLPRVPREEVTHLYAFKQLSQLDIEGSFFDPLFPKQIEVFHQHPNVFFPYLRSFTPRSENEAIPPQIVDATFREKARQQFNSRVRTGSVSAAEKMDATSLCLIFQYFDIAQFSLVSRTCRTWLLAAAQPTAWSSDKTGGRTLTINADLSPQFTPSILPSLEIWRNVRRLILVLDHEDISSRVKHVSSYCLNESPNKDLFLDMKYELDRHRRRLETLLLLPRLSWLEVKIEHGSEDYLKMLQDVLERVVGVEKKVVDTSSFSSSSGASFGLVPLSSSQSSQYQCQGRGSQLEHFFYHTTSYDENIRLDLDPICINVKSLSVLMHSTLPHFQPQLPRWTSSIGNGTISKLETLTLSFLPQGLGNDLRIFSLQHGTLRTLNLRLNYIGVTDHTANKVIHTSSAVIEMFFQQLSASVEVPQQEKSVSETAEEEGKKAAENPRHLREAQAFLDMYGPDDSKTPPRDYMVDTSSSAFPGQPASLTHLSLHFEPNWSATNNSRCSLPTLNLLLRLSHLRDLDFNYKSNPHEKGWNFDDLIGWEKKNVGCTLPALESFSYIGPLHAEGLASLSLLPYLKKLLLRDTYLRWITACYKHRRDECPLIPKRTITAWVDGCTHLQELSLHSLKPDGDELKELVRAKELRKISFVSVQMNPITVQQLEFMRECEALKEVELDQVLGLTLTNRDWIKSTSLEPPAAAESSATKKRKCGKVKKGKREERRADEDVEMVDGTDATTTDFTAAATSSSSPPPTLLSLLRSCSRLTHFHWCPHIEELDASVRYTFLSQLDSLGTVPSVRNMRIVTEMREREAARERYLMKSAFSMKPSSSSPFSSSRLFVCTQSQFRDTYFRKQPQPPRQPGTTTIGLSSSYQGKYDSRVFVVREGEKPKDLEQDEAEMNAKVDMTKDAPSSATIATTKKRKRRKSGGRG